MYTPRAFREERIEVLHRAMRDIAAAAIVGFGAEGLRATHVPIVVDAEPEPLGTLRCHFNRANPQAREAASGGELLAIFQGPQGYISPSFYPSKQETGEVVPTWNYIAIHAYGTATAHEDPGWLRAHLAELTGRHEKNRALPWKVTDAPEAYIERMCQAIVGFEIKLTRIEGKWKLSQNKTDTDRAGVIAGLRAEGDPASLAMAELDEQALAEG